MTKGWLAITEMSKCDSYNILSNVDLLNRNKVIWNGIYYITKD
jgi:hypothetical protein